MRSVLTVILALMTVSYPVAVYFSLEHFSPRLWGALLAGLFALRLLLQRKKNTSEIARWSSLTALVAAAWMLAGNSPLAMRSYPVLVSATLAAVFGFSLRYPPTIIERLARLQDPQLPIEAILYTRKVTYWWLGFFIINGSISAYTAYWGTLEQWTLYNGLISYGLMGSLFAVEWLIRQVVMKQAKTT